MSDDNTKDTPTPLELSAEALASVVGGTRSDRLTRQQKKRRAQRRRYGGGVGGLSMRIGIGGGS
jgi:hypothetical protein